MSAPLFSNCTLLKISYGGADEDYRSSQAADATVWEGESPAWVEERVLSTVDGGSWQRMRATDVQIDGELPTVEVGANVTLRFRGEVYQREVHETASDYLDSQRTLQGLVLEPV